MQPITQVKQNKYLLHGATIISGLATLFLAIELYLGLNNGSLCGTAACEIVGQYLKISEGLLISFGAVFFGLLSLLLFFSFRYPDQLGKFPLPIIALAMAFDGGLIGFQVFAIQEFCLLCIGVAALLMLIAALYSLSYGTWSLLLCCLLVWLGAFGTHNFIKIPEPTNAYSQMILLSQNKEIKKTNKQPTTITVIFSMECPHCLELISYLAKSDLPEDIIWQFASVDQDKTSQIRINSFLNKATKADNIFSLLQEIKEKPVERATTNNLDMVKKANRKTITFLSNLGINNIPVLVADTANNEKRLLIGLKSAHSFMEKYLHPAISDKLNSHENGGQLPLRPVQLKALSKD